MNIIEEIIKCFKQYKIELTKKEAKKFYELNRELFKSELKLDCCETEHLSTKKFSAKNIEEARKEYLEQVNSFFDYLENTYKTGTIKSVTLEKYSHTSNEIFRIDGLLPVKENVKVYYIIHGLLQSEPNIRYENNQIFIMIGNFELNIDFSSYKNKKNIGTIIRKANKKRKIGYAIEYLCNI